jgi:superfamily II DNA or RNA helicase
VLEHLVAIRPYPFQETMLESLALERERGRNSNLVVAATGTGKTVVAALDYKQLRKDLSRSRLLFVAHRQEILKQSQTMFRHVLGDGSFGELWVDGGKPDSWEHVFASIQSISVGDIKNYEPDHFDVVIVDEFHHAAATTYGELLGYLRPKSLLGLTATPERTDQQDILHHFDGRIAVELRLWDALEQGLLVPFHYFGIHDGTDLGQLPWKRGYAPADLEGIYTADDVWADKILQAVVNTVGDVNTMRALGFCASVGHARFMADYFERRGLRAKPLDSTSSSEVRRAALQELRDGKLQVLFAVDLFNEGLDIPGIDTILMLRPTDSAMIFLQQLGRGLRREDEKDVLTVLDFVGHQHEKFRFETRFRRMLGRSRRELIDDIENGFPYLPAGTRIQLDRVTREIVLQNVRNSLPTAWRRRVSELTELGNVTLPEYLEHTGLDLVDLYAGDHCWSELRSEAGFGSTVTNMRLGRGVGRLLHVDDLYRINTWSELLSGGKPPQTAALEVSEQRLLHMLMLTIVSPKRGEFNSIGEALELLWNETAIRLEIRDILALLADRRTHRQLASGLSDEVPLQTRATYTRLETLSAIGRANITEPGSHREGGYYDEDLHLYICFVTLQKTERDYSSLTRYQDYAISEELFHWETQHATSAESPTGRRFISQRSNGLRVMLFVREARRTPEGRVAAFFNCGLADYVSHRSSNPIQITWKLRSPLPGDLFAAYRAAVA